MSEGSGAGPSLVPEWSGMRVVLVSTYELGHQPFGLASPAAWLAEAGFDVRCVDLSRDRLDDESLKSAILVGFFLPMHMATRLAMIVVPTVRRLAPGTHLCAYGLYAPALEAPLRALGVETILGGEFEQDLVALAQSLAAPEGARPTPALAAESALPRLDFRVPDRTGLPSLDRYARLVTAAGERLVAGYTEASRGCKHWCRHCPVVPIYQGRFRVVPVDVVIEDAVRQVHAGARHITFGDPDFFNGPRHAVAVVERLARECPGVTYDATIKVEHLVAHHTLLTQLAATGCLFVTSAFESFDDAILAALEKGHTRADIERAVALCREAGVGLAPTFVAFTPWTSLDGYVGLLGDIEALDLVDAVAPIQLVLRLLVAPASRLLERDDVRGLVRGFDRRALVHPWHHPDPRVDALQREVEQIVGIRAGRETRGHVFGKVREAAEAMSGEKRVERRLGPRIVRQRVEVPYLDEPWYC